MALKRWKCNYIEILGKNFVGYLFKRNKISNEDILRLKSPQWELSDDVSHMPIACVLFKILPFKIYVTHKWFCWLPIFFTLNWGSAWIFWKFSSQVKIKSLRQPPVKFLQQFKWLQWEWFSFKVSRWFLASPYASLTTKSSHFVWSITSQNLNQFQKISSLESARKALSACEIWGKSRVVGWLFQVSWFIWHRMTQKSKVRLIMRYAL